MQGDDFLLLLVGVVLVDLYREERLEVGEFVLNESHDLLELRTYEYSLFLHVVQVPVPVDP